MPDRPVVSVLMPCYNAADTLREALDSVARQTLTNFEAIAVDDGSTDATPQILARQSAQDPRFRFIPGLHAGIVAALNRGLRACSAAYIARMDSDDRSHPERLRRQVDFLEANPTFAVVGCKVIGFPQGQVRQGFQVYLDWLNALEDDSDIRREIFVESPLAHPSVTFRRAWVERVGAYQDQGWPEDYDLWLRLYLAGAAFGKVPEVLLEWREHPSRLTRTDPRYSLENFLRLKTYYLARGPLKDRDAIFIWGAGMMGRRFSKQLARQGIHPAAFFDIDPHKIGHTRHGLPVLAPDQLPGWWARFAHPALLVAGGARGARPLIRGRLAITGLKEGQDWWFAA
jgi:glycosyltransferase involved in cell wall biosynthesis